MGLKPIRKKRLFEEIIIAVEKYIRDEKLLPGEKLPPEGDFADKFQVSKTAVREAMLVLQSNGIIDTRPGAGIFLKEAGETIAQKVTRNLMDKEELREIFEFRRSLEVEAAALAAVRAEKEDLRSIRNAQERLEKANRNGELGVEEDYMFHSFVIQACHNSLYQSVFDSISEKFQEGIGISKMQSMRIPGQFEEGNKEHRQIIEAVLKKDSQAAAEAMRNHLLKNERKFWDNL
jgi:DNA-binding FadR family transcriptional regulator